jgi:hypothetical protein
MVDPRHFGPVCDWIHQKRSVGIEPEPAQPGFSLKGRSMASVLAQTDRWHQSLDRQRRQSGEVTMPANTRWPGILVANYMADRVRIEQLTTYEQLVEEGRAMHHCVASYLQSCRKGHCGIFSFSVDGVRALTLEVTADRTVVQVRGKYNRWMSKKEHASITQWLDQARLVLSKHAGLAYVRDDE